MTFRNIIVSLIIVLFAISCDRENDPINIDPPHLEDTTKTDDENGGNISISAADFLAGTDYDELEVEIQYVDGYSPTQESLDNLKNFLESRVNKSQGISFTKTAISSPGKGAYSLSDIQDVEDENRTVNTSGSKLAAYFFFADAEYAENSGDAKVLGIAYGETSMVIFEETIHNHSGGIGEPSRTKLESTVMNHEFGHTLGLVNIDTPMQNDHQDEANGHHCDVESCLMYYQVETTDVVDNLLNGSIPELDDQCIEDLQANGGK